MLNTTAEALLEAGNRELRHMLEGPDFRETSRGPAPEQGWQPIVDARCDNAMIREGLVRRPGETVCHRCWSVVSVSGECYC